MVSLSPIKKQIKNIRKYLRISEGGGLLRRYFVMNAFDGVLTMVGVVMGAYVAGVTDFALVIAIGIATSVAVGVSGLWGAFLTEAAERRGELKSMEKSLHRELKGTEIEEAFRVTTYLTAVVFGLSPFIAAITLLLPFGAYMAFPTEEATAQEVYLASFALAGVVFVLLGIYLGRISRESMVLSALKLLLAGVVCVIIIMLLSGG